MSGIESLVTQVHRGEAAPRGADGQVPNSGIPPAAHNNTSPQQQPQQQQQSKPATQQQQPQQHQQEEQGSCWSRIFCCRSTKATDDDVSSIPQNGTQTQTNGHQSSNQQQPKVQPQQQPQQQATPVKQPLAVSPAVDASRPALQSPTVDPARAPVAAPRRPLPTDQPPVLNGHTNGYTLFTHRNYNPSTNEYDYGEGFHQYLLPPLPPYHKHKKTLVLDLDETLVHSSFKPIDDADFQIQIELEGAYHKVFVRKRPFVDEFLLHVAKNWEVVIFTASLSKYADPLLDILDPHRVISKRLFRESCVHHYKTYYVKDLRLLGRPLSDSTIIDNSHFSYMFQPEQGLPIISWYDDPADTQLRDLLPFLDHLADCRDIAHTMKVSQPLFVDGGIYVPYELPDVPMLPQEDRWTAEDEANLNKMIATGYDANGNQNGSEYQQMLMTMDSNEEFQNNGNMQMPQTPQVNRAGRSALNSPVAAKRDMANNGQQTRY